MNALFAMTELLPRASTFAAGVDRTFVLAAWFAVFLIVLLVGGLALALFAPQRSATANGGFALASRWLFTSALGSALLLAACFVQGTLVWADMQVVPRGAIAIQVALEEKGWSFTYPNGYVATELHLPLDRPVKLAFRGASEPYTFSAPAFRLQVPVALGEGREAWLQATLAGEYDLRSTARPTRKLGDALAQAIVHPQGGYDKWYQDISGPPLDLPPIELGQRSYQMRGCSQCHSLDGSKLVGPSFGGFLSREHKLADGSVVQPDDAYIRESIVDSQAKVVQGFEPVMPPFRGRLHDLEVAGLIAFIKSQK